MTFLKLSRRALALALASLVLALGCKSKEQPAPPAAAPTPPAAPAPDPAALDAYGWNARLDVDPDGKAWTLRGPRCTDAGCAKRCSETTATACAAAAGSHLAGSFERCTSLQGDWVACRAIVGHVQDLPLTSEPAKVVAAALLGTLTARCESGHRDVCMQAAALERKVGSQLGPKVENAQARLKTACARFADACAEGAQAVEPPETIKAQQAEPTAKQCADGFAAMCTTLAEQVPKSPDLAKQISEATRARLTSRCEEGIDETCVAAAALERERGAQHLSNGCAKGGYLSCKAAEDAATGEERKKFSARRCALLWQSDCDQLDDATRLAARLEACHLADDSGCAMLATEWLEQKSKPNDVIAKVMARAHSLNAASPMFEAAAPTPKSGESKP